MSVIPGYRAAAWAMAARKAAPTAREFSASSSPSITSRTAEAAATQIELPPNVLK